MISSQFYDIEQQNIPKTVNSTSSIGISFIYFGQVLKDGADSFIDNSLSRGVLIVKDSDICQGKPTIFGTRIAVTRIVEIRYVLGWDFQKIKDAYPSLSDEQINAALEHYDENKKEIDRYLEEDRLIDDG